MKARLGSLIVDEAKHLVMQGATRLDISRKAVELLILLGRAGGRAMRRETLAEELWTDRVVSDKALSMLVVDLRRHLLPHFNEQDPIQTVPAVGYRLSIPYEQCDLPAELAWDSAKTRGRMSIAVAAPRLLTSGVRAVELAACLHDSLLNALGGEPDLKVSAREADPEAAPDSFTFIIQASVRVVKREVVLGLRCVNPLDQEICWAASERAALCDALDAESKLCNQLLQELRSVAAGYWGRQAWKQYRQSSGFAAFAEGQQFVAARNIASFSIARQKFQRALQLDPSCAPALVGMADCEMLDAWYGTAEAQGASQRATIYVERALALNSDLAVAHSTRGFIHLNQLRFESAEREFLEAIRLDDSSAIALQWYADLLASQGRLREALQVGHMAVTRAPRNAVVNAQLGQLLHMAGTYEEAQTQLERTLAIDPLAAGAYSFLGLTLAMRGMSGAIEHARRAVELSPHTPFYFAVYATVLARSGERERALQQLHALEAKAPRSPAFAEAAMLAAGSLGLTKRAIEWFRLATSHGAAWSLCTPMLPVLAPMREEPAFQALVHSRGMTISAVQ